jgi:hypothetical protein
MKTPSYDVSFAFSEQVTINYSLLMTPIGHNNEPTEDIASDWFCEYNGDAAFEEGDGEEWEDDQGRRWQVKVKDRYDDADGSEFCDFAADLTQDGAGAEEEVKAKPEPKPEQ